jgi:hypothetical protein
MKNINDNVFLSKISQRIKNGDFDTYLTFPLMTRELLYLDIKERINKKIDTGGTPILNDNEIKDCLIEVKETAVTMIGLYLKIGFIKRTEEGFEFTKTWDLALRTLYKS